MTFLIVCWLRLACDPGVGWSLPGTPDEAWEVAHRIEAFGGYDLRCGVYDQAHQLLVSELPLSVAPPPPVKVAARPRRGR